MLRLDAIAAGLWARASQGDARSAEVVLKIMDRRAKLLGIGTPAPVEQYGAILERYGAMLDRVYGDPPESPGV